MRRTSLAIAVLSVSVACTSSGGGSKSDDEATDSGADGDDGGGNGGEASSAGGARNTGGGSNGGHSTAGGAANPGGRSQNDGGAANADGGTRNGGGTANAGGTQNGGGTANAGGTAAGVAPSADDLLARVAACAGTSIRDGFGLDGAGSISMYECSGAVYWKADLDVDCDGIQTPPCDTDVTGQPQTSIVDDVPNGDVNPTLLPYFVIPLGKPETAWYTAHGIELGQVGAVIYQGKVFYGIFADEAGGYFIGEASYAMCQLFLGKPSGGDDPCDPNSGGIDPADITYVTFTGATNQATGADIYNHDRHTEMGIAAATAWLASP